MLAFRGVDVVGLVKMTRRWFRFPAINRRHGPRGGRNSLS